MSMRINKPRTHYLIRTINYLGSLRRGNVGGYFGDCVSYDEEIGFCGDDMFL